MYLALESEFQDYTTTDDIDLVNTQCSKIRKKVQKHIFCYFKNAPEKSLKIAFLVVSNFFLVQKLILCHF